MNTQVAITRRTTETLQAAIAGQVSVPGEAGYDQARQAWNLASNQRPSVVVLAESPSDAVHAMRFARPHGMRVALRGTGRFVRADAGHEPDLFWAVRGGGSVDGGTARAMPDILHYHSISCACEQCIRIDERIPSVSPPVTIAFDADELCDYYQFDKFLNVELRCGFSKDHASKHYDYRHRLEF